MEWPGQLSPQSAAEKAVGAIGLGYDVCRDIRLSGCKSRVMELDHSHTRELVFPDSVVVPDVPTSVKCHQGERFRDSSDVLSFEQMSEQFNQELSLSGKIPSGLFNAMFDMRRCWPKDAASTKNFAYDGWFITLYNVELDRKNITLSEDVKKEVPSSWNPAALAEFIEKYGTHVIVGMKMGGKDVVHIKQSNSSDLPPTELQKLLKQLADERFSEDSNRSSNINPAEISGNLKDDHAKPWRQHKHFLPPPPGRPVVRSLSKNEDIMSISVRRGGTIICQSYNQWLSTISQSPNVISMSFVPITSLLNSVPGNGFLTHAVNLYLKYKPPIEELHQFLQFQLVRQWAPVYELPLRFGSWRGKTKSPALQFSFMGPKLYVNTAQVDSGCRPVTGIRLFFEGRKSDHLGIHLQHLSNLPSNIQILDNHEHESIDDSVNRAYFEPVKCRMFSHVCTAPVECSDSHTEERACIVTKARFEVRLIKRKKVLFLRLGYSALSSSGIRKSEWGGISSISRRSGFFSTLLSTTLSKGLHQIETDQKLPKEDTTKAVAYNSKSNTDAPVPTKPPKFLRFVDTKEVVRGPEDTPGHWVVTGAKLWVEGGKISVKVKYSLLDYLDMDKDIVPLISEG